MTNRVIASDELEPPKGADKGAVYGPVPAANTATEEQDDYPTATFGTVPNVPTTNVKGFTPYRGNEQHGVRFTHDEKTSTPQISHYQAEQMAFENYVDPKITPRDLSPVPPLRVKIVDTPNLLNQRRCDIRTVALDKTAGIVQLVPEDWNRVRLVIQVWANAAAVTGWLKTKNDANKSFDAIKVVASNAGAPIQLLDTQATDSLYFSVDDGAGATDTITVSLYYERPVYDGETLLG